MLVVLIILAIALIVFGYLLFIPITLRLNILIGDKISAVSAVKIFPFERKFITGKPKKEKKEPERLIKSEMKVEAEPEKKLENKFKLPRLTRTDLAIIFNVFGETMKLIGRLFRSPHYFLRADIGGGAEYPDVTGELYGAYQALRPVLPGSISIIYNPDFAAEKFSGTVEVGLVIRIFRLLWETLIFVFRLPIIRMIKLYRKLKKGV
jgi:hypothetical protein